jgi:hypothetical protein
VSAVADHDRDDRARRQRASDPILILILVASGVFALLAVVAFGGFVAFLLAGRAAPDVAAPDPALVWPEVAPEETGDWTHADLLTYLNRRGLGVGMVMRSTPFGADDGPAAFFIEAGYREVDADNPIELFEAGNPHIVHVQLTADPQRARDKAAALGANGWSWGRFLFRVGDEGRELLERIEAALE